MHPPQPDRHPRGITSHPPRDKGPSPFRGGSKPHLPGQGGGKLSGPLLWGGGSPARCDVEEGEWLFFSCHGNECFVVLDYFTCYGSNRIYIYVEKCSDKLIQRIRIPALTHELRYKGKHCMVAVYYNEMTCLPTES